MPRYKVLLTREVTEHAFALVDALNPEEAEELALDARHSREIQWERNEGSEGSPYICDPSGCAELIN